MSFNIIKNKQRTIIDLLIDVDKKRKYTLYIATCYFTPEQLTKFIEKISDVVNIAKIKIFLDKRSAIQCGMEELNNLNNKLSELYEIEIGISKRSNLFHTKAYALVAYTGDNEIASSALVLGSANCTWSGLNNNTGNIESLICTRDHSDIEEFILGLDRIGFQDFSTMLSFSSSDDIAFQFALMNMGYFYTTWQDSLEKYFRVTFKLTEKGKEEYKTSNKVLIDNGFTLVAGSIGKQYFHFENIKLASVSEDINFRNSIETRFGGWIPKNIVNELFYDDNGFEEFKKQLWETINTQQKKAVENLLSNYNQLVEDDLINAIENFNIESNSISKKLDRLKDENSESILERIYYKLIQSNFPYDIKENDKIETIFYEMYEMCLSKTRRNLVQKLFLEAIDEVNLSQILNLSK